MSLIERKIEEKIILGSFSLIFLAVILSTHSVQFDKFLRTKIERWICLWSFKLYLTSSLYFSKNSHAPNLYESLSAEKSFQY